LSENGVTLLLEIKGLETEQDRAKHQAARRWVEAVNKRHSQSFFNSGG
jgi:hypothetical protein